MPPRRVLLVSAFGSDFALYSQVASDIRSQLAARHPGPLEFFDVPLDVARTYGEEEQAALVAYLEHLLRGRRLSLVVTVGAPALRFATFHRRTLFDGVPVLYAGVDLRFLPFLELDPLDAVSPIDIDLQGQFQTLLTVLPETENLAVVFGSSPIERAWRETTARLLERYAGRLRPIWLDGLTLAELRSRVAALPPRTAIFFGMLLVDRAGVPYSQERVLNALHEVANAPIFGVFERQIGAGAVGGIVLHLSAVADQAVGASLRLLAGEPPAAVRLSPLRSKVPVFDDRELRRWRIPESRLPAGSLVRFHEPSLWSEYRAPIAGAQARFARPTALIAGLLVHRRQRHIAEREILTLHGRLVTAFEQERRRLARDLHDDVTQRLARLVIDGAQIERAGATPEGAARLHAMRDELVRLGRDVHALSRRLHPAILYDLGLTEALRSEAERFAHGGETALVLRLDGAPERVPPEIGLCLFRIAQEALRNIERHAHASRIELALERKRGGVELTVSDDGVGFDPRAADSHPGLGHVSMRERIHLIGGRLRIESALGRGTTVRAWAPLAEVTE